MTTLIVANPVHSSRHAHDGPDPITPAMIGTMSTADIMTAVESAVVDLVNGAPGALNTLGEIAAQMANDETGLSALITTVAAKALDTAVVHLTGVENIGGAKTFVVSPTVPAPTAAGHAVRKADLDAIVIPAGAVAPTQVHLAGGDPNPALFASGQVLSDLDDHGRLIRIA